MDKAESNGRKWIVFSGIALLCAAAVFCMVFIVGHVRENAADYTPDQVTEHILSQQNTEELVRVDPEQIPKHYEIPDGVVSGSSLYMSKSSESASELACFLLTEVSKYEQLQPVITAHLNSKAAGFKSLNPTQYNALQNAVIARSGRYVLVAVGKESETQKKNFSSLFAGKL